MNGARGFCPPGDSSCVNFRFWIIAQGVLMRLDGTLLAEYSSEIGMTKEGRDGFDFFVVHL